ncbi:MAG: NAD(P)-dependent glycerol-3-phosphate dehydrogenase [Gammaproteobacteria bacterium]|nr:NAD(P)-dependent glycerol-3-phosphate dehydrogenase [Gammaproteobacteria bacterium]
MTAKPITVLGAGSFGTALAVLLARNHNLVPLWGHNPEHINALKTQHQNKRYLPNIKLSTSITPMYRLAAAVDAVDDILIAVPSYVFRDLLIELKPLLKDHHRIAWGTKGLDPKSHQLLHEVVQSELGSNRKIAVLSGPSFAAEIATNRPTAISLAGNDQDFLDDLSRRLHNNRFRVYQNSDLIGVEICGAVKNVLAIATGITDGLKLGANTRAALMTRGLIEMRRLCIALGGSENTVLSLAGVGDSILTCTDDQSRNRRFGFAIGQGESTKTAKKLINQVIEGVDNAEQIYLLAKKHKIDMPIVNQVHNVIHGNLKPVQAIHNLLSRSPKSE